MIGENEAVPKEDNALQMDESSLQGTTELPAGSLGALIGKDMQTLIASLGKPTRKEPSAYGYTWFIYNSDVHQYVQIGVLDEKVVTLYAIGKETNIAPFEIDQSVENIFINNLIAPEVTLKQDGSSFQFELSENDLNTRPLIKVGNIYAQLYIDRYSGVLSSVRFLDGETLIKLQPYEMLYLGNLIEAVELSKDEWEKIEEGTELQILDITNVIRAKHDFGKLSWDEKTATVAYAHSKDMKEADYFAHVSEEYGTLSDRLVAADVPFQLAGENIAAQYSDGPAVVEGWLNSKGHREALLNKEFTHLGVGVYQRYYTQNFVKSVVE